VTLYCCVHTIASLKATPDYRGLGGQQLGEWIKLIF